MKIILYVRTQNYFKEDFYMNKIKRFISAASALILTALSVSPNMASAKSSDTVTISEETMNFTINGSQSICFRITM